MTVIGGELGVGREVEIGLRGDNSARYMRAKVTRLVVNEQLVLVWNEIADSIMRGALQIACETAGVGMTKVVVGLLVFRCLCQPRRLTIALPLAVFYYQGLWPWLTQSDFESSELASMQAMCGALKRTLEATFRRSTSTYELGQSAGSAFGVARQSKSFYCFCLLT